jgi:hypothetical protein
MALMKNKYLIFENIEFTPGVNVRNTTTLNLLPDIPEKFFSNEYLLTKKIQDDTLLEAISFELYETTDYWDVLMIINDMKSMNELPVNYDIILDRVDIKLYKWKKKGNLLSSVMTDEVIDKKYKEILQEEVELNEKFRFIKYISQDSLSELISELDKLKSSKKINKKILI